MVVVAYGLILPKRCSIRRVWAASTSTAPAATLAWCRPDSTLHLGGDAETGVTIMQMDVGLDTGAMIRKVICPIASDETSASLYDKLAGLGPAGTGRYPGRHGCRRYRCRAPGRCAGQLRREALQGRRPASTGRWTLLPSSAASEPSTLAHQLVRRRRTDRQGWQAEVVAQDHGQAAGTLLKADKQGIEVATGQGAAPADPATSRQEGHVRFGSAQLSPRLV